MAHIFRKQILNLSCGLLGIALIPSCTFFSHHDTQQAVATKTIYSFLGAPGSGKGTLSELCVKQLGFKTVSTGNLCREEIASGSEKGAMLAACTRSALLVPDEIITQMVETWLSKQTGTTPIILDGYPRTQKQAQLLAELLKTKFTDYHLRVVSLDVSDYEEIVKRISNRLICEKCQAVYNRDLMKNSSKLICEKCGGKLIQRDDDKEAVVRKRLQQFEKNNNEIIAFYKSVGIPVESLPVSHSSPQQIFENFKKIAAA